VRVLNGLPRRQAGQQRVQRGPDDAAVLRRRRASRAEARPALLKHAGRGAVLHSAPHLHDAGAAAAIRGVNRGRAHAHGQAQQRELGPR